MTALSLDRAAIEAAIPHRDPFLFLDRVTDGDESFLVGEWDVPVDAAWFQGHFPGQPVLPGVLISEHAFQAAAVLISRALGGFSADDGVPVLTRIENAKYRRMVTGGETLVTRAEVVERVGPAWRMRATVRTGGAKVAELAYVLTAVGALARLGV
ncbi:MAG: 3-hydroxyacyl-ACP dehydratase FabZ family protein [Planctomycetota bacterium]